MKRRVWLNLGVFIVGFLVMLGWLTSLDQAFGQSPRFSIVRLNERDLRVSILHSIYNASRGNLSSRHLPIFNL